MTKEQLRKFIFLQTRTEAELVDFISCVKEQVASHDENMIANLAVNFPDEMWLSPAIQQIMRTVDIENYNLRVVCKALSCTYTENELTRGLDYILESRLAQSVGLTEILVRLHNRNVISVKKLVLPLLHWYCPTRLGRPQLEHFVFVNHRCFWIKGGCLFHA